MYASVRRAYARTLHAYAHAETHSLRSGEVNVTTRPALPRPGANGRNDAYAPASGFQQTDRKTVGFDVLFVITVIKKKRV